MSEAAPAPSKKADPEDFRMTIGEHLEELRKRLFLGVGGFALAFFVFMVPSIGERVVYFLLEPLLIALAKNGMTAQVHPQEVAEAFMVYIKAAMISAFTVAGPWILYQMWLFIAAGLYPHERKYITKYLPLSVALFFIGITFLYFYVLPLMLQFFIGFQIGPPLDLSKIYKLQATSQLTTLPTIPILNGDPPDAPAGSFWLNSKTGMLRVSLGSGLVRVIPFGSENAVSPLITLEKYFDMVIGLLLSFGLAFQLPLVVLALVRIGIMEIQTLKNLRRIVYFILTIVAAVIVPDVVTGMIALLIPLVLLYEFGILLAGWGGKKDEADRPAA